VMKPMSAKLKIRPPKMANPWGYAAGGTVDEDPTDDAETEQPTFNTQQPPMRELAAMLSKEQPAAEAPAEATRTPATAKENVLGLREQLQKYLGKQASGSDNMQKLAEMYGKALGEGNDRTDLSPLLALSDSLYGSKLQGSYKRPLTGMEQLAEQMKAQGLVDKSNAATTSAAEKEYGQDTNAVSKEQAAYWRGINSDNSKHRKDEGDLDKMEQNFAKAMNPMSSVYGGGNNNLGMRLARARSANALLMQHPDLNLDPREQKDFALSTATLLSNQNRVPYELVQDLVPHTFKGDYAKAVEYFFNHPKETNSQEFVRRMADTIQKEQMTATEQIKAIQQQQAQGFYPLAVKRPERYKAHLAAGSNFLSLPGLDEVPGVNTKMINGVKYQKVQGGWKKVKQQEE
jgi:hypothetical protein